MTPDDRLQVTPNRKDSLEQRESSISACLVGNLTILWLRTLLAKGVTCCPKSLRLRFKQEKTPSRWGVECNLPGRMYKTEHVRQVGGIRVAKALSRNLHVGSLHDKVACDV